MEQMVELRPGNTPLRFSLAYKHSELDNSDMALHHYLRIPIFERDAITWNNIGVAYGAFEMPVKAVDAFRLSEESNDPLAMCNLGFKLLNAGFYPQAEKEAENALAIKPQHKNVPELLKRLNEVRDEEEEKLTETVERTKEKAAFYRKLGGGVLKKTPLEIGSDWNSPEGVLEAKIDGSSVRIFGAHERPVNLLGGLLAQPVGGLGLIAQSTVTHRIEYSGQLRGSVILGQVKRSRDGEQPSLLSAGNDGVKALMVFNNDYTELFVMEGPDGAQPRLYSLTRAPSIVRQ